MCMEFSQYQNNGEACDRVPRIPTEKPVYVKMMSSEVIPPVQLLTASHI